MFVIWVVAVVVAVGVVMAVVVAVAVTVAVAVVVPWSGLMFNTKSCLSESWGWLWSWWWPLRWWWEWWCHVALMRSIFVSRGYIKFLHALGDKNRISWNQDMMSQKVSQWYWSVMADQWRTYICPEWRTALCVWCYKSFHTVDDLEGKKEDICNKILNRKAG